MSTTTSTIWELDPDAILTFGFDWTDWLEEGETITSQTVSATTGATVSAVSQAAGIVSFTLSAGSDGALVRVTCHIVTSAGQQDDRTRMVRVRQR